MREPGDGPHERSEVTSRTPVTTPRQPPSRSQPPTRGQRPSQTRRGGRSFGGRLQLFLILLVSIPFVLLAATEVLHQLQRGHFFMPFTHHWDLETRDVEVRGNQLREVRPRLTNYTLAPFKIQRLEGDGLLWFRETRYRHRVESRADSAPWRVLHREDLIYERQGRPPHTRTVSPWESITVAWHPVQDANAPGAGTAVLRRGDEVRFVLYTLLDGEEGVAGQRVYRSPAFRL